MPPPPPQGCDSPASSYVDGSDQHPFSPTYPPAKNPLPLCPLTPSIVGIGSGHSYGNTFNIQVFPDTVESQYVIPSCTAQQSRPPPPLVHAAYSSPQSDSDHDQFELVFLTKLSKKCYGCSEEFAKQPDGSNLQPPYNIVIRNADYREYYYDGEKCSTKQNTYFHPCLTCIISKCSSFSSHSLDTSSIKDELLPVNIAFLKNNFPGFKDLFFVPGITYKCFDV